jgi:hypothetical protein
MNKLKARIGMQICRFGLWLTRKTLCWADDHKDIREHKSDEERFLKLYRKFKIQASDLKVVERK